MAAASLLALALLPGCARDTAPERGNVLLILVDTLRADHLGAYGYARETSPHLDAFAARSVLFENARSQAPCTVPSVNSLLTSQHALRFQGRRRKTLKMPLGIPATAASAAEIFRANGYRTAAVSASPVVRRTPTRHNPEGGFDAGFEAFVEDCLREDAACVNRAALGLIDEMERPFFLYLHYMEPHAPYRPPPSYRRRFARDATRGGFVAEGNPKPIGRMLYGRGPEVTLDDADWQHLIDLYDDEIRYFDERFQGLLEALEQRDLTRNTLIVLASDHGENFRDHGHVEHCRDLFDSEIKTPLVIHVPGAGSSRRISLPVQNLDVVPTLVDLLGLDAGGARFDGRSLRPAIEGEALPAAPVLASWNTTRSLVSGPYKVLVDAEAGRVEVYDLSADPGESRDLGARERTLARHLGALLEREFERAGLDVALDPESARALEDRLRELGYLE